MPDSLSQAPHPYWSNQKLVSEVTKQIRRDYGGVHGARYLEQRAIDYGFKPSIARRVAQFTYIVAGEATDGSRRRVRSKLAEILNRLETNA
jgi:hypothetical protein|tara:strand:+ start:1210 stop:1482 length:273 start_codon:yes stop_codon:yes gene_type:complete